jgi:hypothetical protein
LTFNALSAGNFTIVFPASDDVCANTTDENVSIVINRHVASALNNELALNILMMIKILVSKD